MIEITSNNTNPTPSNILSIFISTFPIMGLWVYNYCGQLLPSVQRTSQADLAFAVSRA
jgi:hypothetical protein